MINWIEITQDNFMECAGFYNDYFRLYESNSKYVFLTEKYEIKLLCKVRECGHVSTFLTNDKVTHFALKSEYEAILPKERINND